MPQSNRKRRQRLRNLRQSTRIATKAMRRVIKDVGPQAAHIKPRAIVKGGQQVAATPGLLAYASNPVTFAVESSGKLRGKRFGMGVLSTARHEVAHLLPSKQGDRPTSEMQIRVAGAEQSTFGVKSAARLSREPIGRTVQRVARRRGKYGRAPK